MRAFYEENKSQYRRPPRVQLGQITVTTEEEASGIARSLRSGSDLAWLAEQRSTDKFREKGGVQGWLDLRPGADSLTAALLEAQPGDVLDPIQQEDAWVVYKLLDREELGIYDFEEISGTKHSAIHGKPRLSTHFPWYC